MRTLLLFVCVILSGCNQSDSSKACAPKGSPFVPLTSRYQMIPAVANNAWKIDTQTGTVWLCSAPGNGKVACGEAAIVEINK